MKQAQETLPGLPRPVWDSRGLFTVIYFSSKSG